MVKITGRPAAMASITTIGGPSAKLHDDQRMGGTQFLLDPRLIDPSGEG
jgi:hypothetical protein